MFTIKGNDFYSHPNLGKSGVIQAGIYPFFEIFPKGLMVFGMDRDESGGKYGECEVPDHKSQQKVAKTNRYHFLGP
jgi:hypothetical protein